jgi:sugar lactone lactonase YvrE
MRSKRITNIAAVSFALVNLSLPLAAFGQLIYAPPYTFTTIAGLANNSGTNDGTTSNVRFNFPTNVGVDSNGNVYVTDMENHTIRKISLVGTNWITTTIAGLPGTSGSADGTNSNARFKDPAGLAVDKNGIIIVADSNNSTVRVIVHSGTNWVVTTLAGAAGIPGFGDGTGSGAQFVTPQAVAVDKNDNVFVADNGANTVRRITSAGVVTTVAGSPPNSGSTDGTNGAALFSNLRGIAVDTNGILYVADTNNSTIRKITPVGTNWVVTTIAGLAGSTGAKDGTNSAARFVLPQGVAVDAAGTIYVADTQGFAVRKIVASGTNWVVTTLGGSWSTSGAVDGTGVGARFRDVGGVAVDNAGNVYVSDYAANTIRKGWPFGTGPDTLVLGSSQVNASGADIVVQTRSLNTCTYRLQASNSMTPTNWQNIGTSQISSGAALAFTDPGASTNTLMRFYRFDVSSP